MTATSVEAARNTATTAPLMAPLVREREKLALRLTADGLAGRELARAMGVSPGMARAVLARACRAVERDDPAQAVFAAVVHRLVTADDLSGAVPEAGTLRGEDLAVLEQVVSGLTASEVAAARGWSTDHATAVLDVLRGRFRARTLAHLGALALAHDLVPCHLVDDRLPKVPLSALPAPRTPTTLADAMTYAQQRVDRDETASGEQLSRDLRVASNATTHFAVQDAGGVGQRAVSLARVVCRWLPAAESFRSAASGSPAHLRRWDQAISRVISAGSLSRPLDETAAYAGDVRRLLEAVRDGRRADPGSLATFARYLTFLVDSGEQYLGSRLSAYQIGCDYGLPRSLVEDAIQDLLADGVLEGGGVKAMPAGSLAAQREHAQVVSHRLREQLAAGLYPPETILSTPDLAVSLCATVRETHQALRQLAEAGLVEVSGPARVTEAATHLTTAGRLPSPNPYAHPYTPTTITTTAQQAHTRWRLRRPVSPTELAVSWLTLRHMAAQLLTEARPEDLAVRRAMEAATAPWPGNPRERVWHTACLAHTVTTLQHHLEEAEADR
ncbi:hypothetical protein [Streptomyces albipurpureus]|uniref:Uncharacterized protein n=1 Tax=Streptomyces albipurpureus TaxID=2897419 RepID=A0ABT0UTY5_9ACTN|nr:hypothetical protein [Streptomyces sp. CWNU-1]MCM2392028.1 hypothetical protein [Streptomyces sp. CWNU-1]